MSDELDSQINHLKYLMYENGKSTEEKVNEILNLTYFTLCAFLVVRGCLNVQELSDPLSNSVVYGYKLLQSIIQDSFLKLGKHIALCINYTIKKLFLENKPLQAAGI